MKKEKKKIVGDLEGNGAKGSAVGWRGRGKGRGGEGKGKRGERQRATDWGSEDRESEEQPLPGELNKGPFPKIPQGEKRSIIFPGATKTISGDRLNIANHPREYEALKRY